MGPFLGTSRAGRSAPATLNFAAPLLTALRSSQTVNLIGLRSARVLAVTECVPHVGDTWPQVMALGDEDFGLEPSRGD